MYIRANTGLGDPFAPLPAPARTDWRRRMMPDPPAKTVLVFRRIGPFAVDKSVLTPELKRQITQVVDFVRSRSNTMQAIGVIRIVGHTDSSGTEQHNIGLGNRRMEAVRTELHAQLGDLIRRVLVDVEESPGKSQPIGDNRTAKGRAANRRVDVYLGPTIPKAEGGWTKPYDFTPPDPGPGKQDIWCLDPKNREKCVFQVLGGKTVREFLIDLCRRKLSKDKCEWLVDKFIAGGCKGIEILLGQIGATISEAQKKTIEDNCVSAANKKSR
jgi:outer membrane protein OmpA-like peptidoglycan-associated protein